MASDATPSSVTPTRAADGSAERPGRYPEHGSLDLVAIDDAVRRFWEERDVFRRTLEARADAEPFVFYEGPPSANGKPGIHHVMSRTIKDLFCRYQTQKGRHVARKGGWDTHGLPVEIAVEKTLGITKEDIGKSISVEDYNAACRKEVLKYKADWDELTRRIGYWVDLDDPYITFDAGYIESLWHLLRTLYDKGLLYKGYTIQPFSPAAGTGLSTHELNQPGAYRDVKDTTVVAQFKAADAEDEYFLAWTTTPWTLPSNTGLGVGAEIDYVLVDAVNPYTGIPVKVWLAEALRAKYFPDDKERSVAPDADGAWSVLRRAKGSELAGRRYEQLLPFARPEDGDPFRVVAADFVSTEDGTGIVHLAPSFGADDMRAGAEHGLGALTLVDRQGRFTEDAGPYAGRYVKDYRDEPDYVSVDVDIAVQLKGENKAWKIEKYVHSYPHCWRTDKPVLYYPLDSWFIRTTAVKERMIELNRTIGWKPPSTGEGRFGQWLENLVDWNLSRSRFWGTPLPIWRTEDGEEELCVGSFAQLREEVDRAVAAGLMDAPLGEAFDPHRPFVDRIVLVSPSGKPMHREPDLIDVWFDSGAMPFAQWHYPFENGDVFRDNFPADFIAEGVDQTRGWFFTLHAIATMVTDGVAYRHVVSNGLVLDKDGNKMSKRLGNAVDPFETLSAYGADATRWYLITNAQPWDNLRFDPEGIDQVRRKFFGTLHNTYAFYALYANVDGFAGGEAEVPVAERPEIDRWILSLLNSLVRDVDALYADYEPTRAGRLIQTFVTDHLSNWYVRLCRRRFWKGAMGADKVAAYQTLRQCLVTVSQLMAPIAPFYADFLYRSIRTGEGAPADVSVHGADFPLPETAHIDAALEQRMQLAQDLSSLVLSLRKTHQVKVRQPLRRMLVPVVDDAMAERLSLVRDLVLSEVNIKELEMVRDDTVFTKRIKPDFKALGQRMGKRMKAVAQAIAAFDQEAIARLEREDETTLDLPDGPVTIGRDDVDISTDDMPGYLVASEGALTVALDMTLDEALLAEGLAREFVNRIQRIRKDLDLEVTDRITVDVSGPDETTGALVRFANYICSEILADDLRVVDELATSMDLLINEAPVRVFVHKP
jgi:isoleucyl-tRNA synthetase